MTGAGNGARDDYPRAGRRAGSAMVPIRRITGSTLAVALSILSSAGGCQAPTAAPASNRPSQSAAEAVPLPPQARVALGDLEPSIRQPEAAPPRELSDRGGRQLEQGSDLARQQRYTEAAIELERGLRYDPNHPALLDALARVYWASDNRRRAQTSAESAIAANADSASAHYVLGRIAAADGRIEDAVTSLRTAAACSSFEADPELAALCYFHLGAALEQQEYLTAAAEAYGRFEQRAARVDAGTASTEFTTLSQLHGGIAAEPRARIFERLGDFGRAASEVARLIARRGSSDALALWQARLLLNAGQPGEALTAFRGVESLTPEALDVLRNAYAQLDRPDDYVAELERRLRASPDDAAIVGYLADALEQRGRADEARRVLEAFTRAHPRAAAVRKRLIEHYTSRGEWSRALDEAGAAIEADPADYPTYVSLFASSADAKPALTAGIARPVDGTGYGLAYLLGLAAMDRSDWDAGQRWLSHAMTVNAGFAPARASLGRVYLRQRRWDDAIRVAARAEPNTAEDARLEVIMAKAFEGLDQDEIAELHYRAATQLNRADSEAMFDLAQLYRRTGRSLQYERQLLAVLAEDPLHEPAREAVIRRYIETGNFEEAGRAIDELRRLSASAALVGRCAAMLRLAQTHDTGAYQSALQALVKEHGDDPVTLSALGDSYLKSRQYDEALQCYETARRLEPDDPDTAMNLVRVFYATLEFERAVETLRGLIPDYPNRHRWRLALLELLLVVQDFDAAAALADEQQRRDDLKPRERDEYRTMLIATMRLQHRDAESLSRLETWARAEDPPDTWTTSLIDAYLQEERADAALAEIRRAYGESMESPTARSLVTAALSTGGRHVQAAQLILGWLADDPNDPVTTRRLIRSLAAGDRIDDALELVRNQMADPTLRDGYVPEYASLLDEAGRHAECARFLDDYARETDPSTAVRMFLVAAEQWVRAGEYAQAERRLTEMLDSLRDKSSVADCAQLLALCYQEQGFPEQAAQMYERALSLRPNDALLNNNLGYMWVDRGEHLDKAERMIRLAVSESPRQTSYLDSLGWVLYKRGDFTGAYKWLLRAARAERDADAVVLDHLADAAWRTGAREEAISWWTASVAAAEDVLSDDPDNAEIRQTLEATKVKLERARAGEEPQTAPAGGSTEAQKPADPPSADPSESGA